MSTRTKSSNGVQAETNRHLRVFRVFFNLGPARTVPKLERILADLHPEIESTKNTLYGWSRMWRWAARARRMDKEVVAKVEGDLIQSTAVSVCMYCSIIDDVLLRYAQKLADDPEACPIESVSDLERIMKMRLQLAGLNEDGSRKSATDRLDTEEQPSVLVKLIKEMKLPTAALLVLAERASAYAENSVPVPVDVTSIKSASPKASEPDSSPS